jgi:hypothetical protein
LPHNDRQRLVKLDDVTILRTEASDSLDKKFIDAGHVATELCIGAPLFVKAKPPQSKEKWHEQEAFVKILIFFVSIFLRNKLAGKRVCYKET